MVGNEAHGHTRHRAGDPVARLKREYPELELVVEAAAGTPVYAVGGAVRDLVAGRPRTDLDLAVEGDPYPIAGRLGGAKAVHERFMTATVAVAGLTVDLARTRTETYPHPGALPVVEPAGIDADLARRDFTVNAMAVPVNGDRSASRLIDPFDGFGDLRGSVLRALHERSFVDDATRVLRGARYAAVFGLEPDAVTRSMFATADLDSVSLDRREAELRRLICDPAAIAALRLLESWGIGEASPERVELAERASELACEEPWRGWVDPVAARWAAVRPVEDEVAALAEFRPGEPLAAVEAARGRTPAELVTAYLLGADWVEEYVETYRWVELEIGGKELTDAGIPEGPAVGRGLREALRRKLAGELDGPRDELRVALEAAGGGGDGVG